MAFARGIAFMVASFAANIFALSGGFLDGELSGGVILLNIIGGIFGWLGWRDLRGVKRKDPRARRMSSRRMEAHLQKQVEAHMRQLKLEEARRH